MKPINKGKVGGLTLPLELAVIEESADWEGI